METQIELLVFVPTVVQLLYLDEVVCFADVLLYLPLDVHGESCGMLLVFLLACWLSLQVKEKEEGRAQ